MVPLVIILESAAPTPLPFLATLYIPYLYNLTNDPTNHKFLWPPTPHKIPADIPKFEGKQGDDPERHVTTYHLWCFSNSMIDDSIWNILFPYALTGNVAK